MRESQKFYALNFYEFIPGIVGGIPRIFLLARGCSRRSGLEFSYCEVPRHNLVSWIMHTNHRAERWPRWAEAIACVSKSV
jgi:hypothetical protein